MQFLSLQHTRRTFLALGLASALRARASGTDHGPGFGKAKSVLVVFASGGQSQLELWDPKPNAPVEVRGAFQSIPTATPGVRFGEYLPKLAKRGNKFTVIRSMTHDDVDHGSAVYASLTGQFHQRKSSNPDPKPTDMPSIGAILQRVRPSKKFPHASCMINGPLLVPINIAPGLGGGFLGRGYDPIMTGDPTQAWKFSESLNLPEGVTSNRSQSRRELAERLDCRLHDATSQSIVSTRKSAYELLDKPAIRDAFDLSKEPDALRDQYGRHRSGESCLLARRLVEAGVPWVTAFFNHTIRGQDTQPDETNEYGWDTHNDIFMALKDHLLPRFDQTFSMLLDDMEQRGLLKDTLVICMGEFGRAPIVALEKNFAGSSPGRKHWAACYSVLMAGAGISSGVYGSSDRQGAYPQANPTTPGDLVATAFHALGIDPGSHYNDLNERPYRIATGSPITKLFE